MIIVSARWQGLTMSARWHGLTKVLTSKLDVEPFRNVIFDKQFIWFNYLWWVLDGKASLWALNGMSTLWELDDMASCINLPSHSPNQSVLSTPTTTASCATTVILTVRVLPDSYFPASPQSIRYFYADQHRILRCSCESVRPSSDQFPASLALLRLHWPPPRRFCPSWLWGVGFVSWYSSTTSDSAVPMSLSVLPMEESRRLHTRPTPPLRSATMFSVNPAPLICPRWCLDDEDITPSTITTLSATWRLVCMSLAR